MTERILSSLQKLIAIAERVDHLDLRLARMESSIERHLAVLDDRQSAADERLRQLEGLVIALRSQADADKELTREVVRAEISVALSDLRVQYAQAEADLRVRAAQEVTGRQALTEGAKPAKPPRGGG